MNAHIQQVTQNESHIKYSLVLNDLDKVNLDDSMLYEIADKE